MKLPIYIADSITGLGTAGLTITGAEIKTSVDGAPLANGGGVVAGIGSGAYYYSPTAAEQAGSILTYAALKTGKIPFGASFSTPITGDFAAGATGAERYISVYLATTANVAITGAEPDPDAGELEVSIDGAAFVAAEGTWIELGDGEYIYDPSDDEAELPGLFLVKVTGVAPDTITAAQIGEGVTVVVPPEPVEVPDSGNTIADEIAALDLGTIAMSRIVEQFRSPDEE